jgi:putative transposase
MAEMYRTQQIHIKKGHRLYPYLEQLSFDGTNLYNVTNYYIRQVFTGLKKETKDFFDNEKEAISYINEAIAPLNEQRYKAYVKRESKKPSGKEFFEFKPLKSGDFMNYEMLEGVFKTMKQVDYYELPGQLNQNIMKLVFRDWKSFFKSIKDYKENPLKYTGRPSIPKYKKKSSKMTVTLTNQICTLKDDKYLRFPKTSEKLNIGKYMSEKGKLKEVRVVPKKDVIILEIIFSMENNVSVLNPDRIAAIDLGVNNLVTIGNNIGLQPIIIKGGAVKSMNQYYNKQRANYYGQLRKGLNHKQGVFTSNRLNRFDHKRHLKVKDYFHKTSYWIIQYCIEHHIGTLVIGKNNSFKNNVKMHKNDKQNFIQLPFELLINMLLYKSEAAGINIVIQEESYTSKASFLDEDDIPVYGQENGIAHKFSGRRISRGRYKTKDDIIINADVNAAYNILKKATANAFDKIRSRGVGLLKVTMSTPLVVTI